MWHLSGFLLGFFGLTWSAVTTLGPEALLTTAASTRLCGDGQAYGKNTKKCYTTGERGPCGNNSDFLLDYGEGKIEGYGICSCYDDHNNGPKCGLRPALLWPEDSSCYPIYDQGPCLKGQWLTKSSTGAKCESNPCIDHVKQQQQRPQAKNDTPAASGGFIFPHNGQCYETDTQAHCKGGQVALIQSALDGVQCFNKETGACLVLASIGIGAGNVDCVQGTVAGEDGNCEPIAQI